MQKKDDNIFFVRQFWRHVSVMLKNEKISKKRFAQAIGISQQDLSNRLDSDSTRGLSLELALKIADFFAVPVYRFIDCPTGPLVYEKEQLIQERQGIVYREEFLEQFHFNVNCILQYTPLIPEKNYQPFELIKKLDEYANELIDYVNKKRFTQYELFMYESTHDYYSNNRVKEILHALREYHKHDIKAIKESKAEVEKLIKELFDTTIQYGLFGFEILVDNRFTVTVPDERTYNNSNSGSKALFCRRYWEQLEEFKAGNPD